MSLTLKKLREITGNKTLEDFKRLMEERTGKPYDKIKKIRVSDFENLRLS